jgi:hypothetical protein
VSRSAAILGATLVSVIGCVPQSYILRSDHFTLTMPRAWELVKDARSPRAAAIVRVPAGDAAGGRLGPELRIYPWLARAPIAQPTEEALKRLAQEDDDELGLRAALPANRDRCGTLVDRFSLFGGPQTAVHLETAFTHLIVVAGQSQWSLVAVVGVVSTARYCRDLAVMEEAMGTLGTALTGADPSERPTPVPPVFAPLPPYPAPELPAPPSP